MTNYLNALVVTLRKLGKPFSKEEVNNKILRILPKKDWESRVTSIEEAQDLANLPTDVLIGKLLTHELSIKQRDEELVEKEDKRKARERKRGGKKELKKWHHGAAIINGFDHIVVALLAYFLNEADISTKILLRVTPP